MNKNDNDDKEEIKLNRYLKIEKDDMIFIILKIDKELKFFEYSQFLISSNRFI